MPRVKSHGSLDLNKAKDFKGSIKRLVKELSGYKTFIIVSFVLAIVGAILSISAPSKLSSLTDTISDGLVVNKDNLALLQDKITKSLNEDKFREVASGVLNFNLSDENIYKIMMSSDISDEEKEVFKSILASINMEEDKSLVFTYFKDIPDSILKLLLSDSTYKGKKIVVDDKITFLHSISNKEKMVIPDAFSSVFFDEVIIDGVKISSVDLCECFNILSSMDDDSDVNKLYANIDKMPESIKKIVEPDMNINKIKTIGLTLLIMYLCSALFTYIEALCMTNVSNNFARSLRGRISVKINKLPLKYFDGHFIGDILSRVTNDVDTIAQSMNQSLSSLVSAITLFIGSIIMMFTTNSLLAITAIVASLFGFMFMFVVLSKSQKYFMERQTGLGNLNGHIEEVYSGLNVVKAYNGEKISNEKFDLYNENLRKSSFMSQFLSGLMMPMMNFIGNFGYVAVCIVGALLTINGKISFGVIVAFISYVRLFTSPLSEIAQSMTSLQSVAASSERVFEFLDEEEMRDESLIKTKLLKGDVLGNVCFSDVVFTYDGNEEPTIKGFSANVKSGEKVAIVGPTGAGKTTMVNLLMKFYDITSGDILIDGKSIHDLTRENIHNLFTMVLQDTWVFDGTVKENIVYNRKNVSDKRVEEVCKIVGVDHFIKTLPNGYDSKLSDSDSISAGQRQLLTIARGMIEDAPLLILDEATSNVDTRTEELVQKAMDKLMKGKTSFIIAHRLSTIKNADLILVMKDGNIIEQGNHDELMKKRGFYAELYNSQFEL